MKAKYIVPALCAAMLISSLSACADSGGAPESSSAPANTGAVSDTASQGASAEETESEEAPSGSNEEKPPAEEEPPVNDAVLTFSAPAGFYESDFKLEIYCDKEGAEIRYTSDGSTPSKDSDLYTSPIRMWNRTLADNVLANIRGVGGGGDYVPKGKLDKANIIRAAAFFPDGSRSEILNGTFFVGINRKGKYGAAPVISLITDTKNLYNYETGIFVLGKTHDDWLAEDPKNAKLDGWQQVGNYSNKGRAWERPVSVEYFTADGERAFSQTMGMRVMGAASRAEMQKSLRLTAREEYGKKSVKYEIIPDNIRSDGSGAVEKYKSFVLRNGGNDCNFAKVRDPYLQSLVYDRRFDTEQFTPCVVFLDGEYWGMYTLGEDYSDNYIENNYGINNNNVIVVKRGSLEDGTDGDMDIFYEMFDFITGNDMTVRENYEKAASMLDIGSFADYCAFNLYIYNEDSMFKNNNWEMWRARTPDGSSGFADGKWRMMVYDVDYSSGIYAEGKNYSRDNISEVLKNKPVHIVAGDTEERHPALIFLSLYENEDFRREFVNALCDIRNINFESNKALSELSEVAAEYEKLVPDNFKRFGPDWVAWQDTHEYFGGRINELGVFIEGRYKSFPSVIHKALKPGEQAALILSVSSDDKGEVLLNSSRIGAGDGFTGIYFTDYDITLTAVPKNGAKFVRWECEGCTVSDANSASVTVSFEGDFSVKAVFE